MKIGTVSLGCDKNRVDTEKMLSRLVAGGHSLVGSEEYSDIIIVNTCAFIDSAKTESIDEILKALSYKEDGKKVIVTGCLSQRYLAELKSEFCDVDAFLGVADYDNILSVVESVSNDLKVDIVQNNDGFCKERVLTTPYHYAYLKIADGCDNHCTYCAIPKIRGKYRSEKMSDLLAEAEILSKDGVKEIILVAQDVIRYGYDWDAKSHLIELLIELEKLDFCWIRLLYLEPEVVTDELIEYISTSKKVVKYMDIPLQHISNNILKLMNRHTTKEYSYDLIKKVKSKGIAVRTSFICGFCREEEEDFLQLKQFVEEMEIDFAGFFAYSREEGTPADKISGHIDENIKIERVNILQQIQTDIINCKNKRWLNNTYDVIYDDIDYDKQMFVGRTQYQAPDIDSVVYFTSNQPLQIGEIYKVEMIDVCGIDLIGRVKDV